LTIGLEKPVIVRRISLTASRHRSGGYDSELDTRVRRAGSGAPGFVSWNQSGSSGGLNATAAPWCRRPTPSRRTRWSRCAWTTAP